MSTVVDGTRIRWQNLLENKIKKKEKQPWMNCQFESAGRHQQATVLKFKPTNLCSFFTSPFLSSRILFTHMTVFFARFLLLCSCISCTYVCSCVLCVRCPVSFPMPRKKETIARKKVALSVHLHDTLKTNEKYIMEKFKNYWSSILSPIVKYRL